MSTAVTEVRKEQPAWMSAKTVGEAIVLVINEHAGRPLSGDMLKEINAKMHRVTEDNIGNFLRTVNWELEIDNAEPGQIFLRFSDTYGYQYTNIESRALAAAFYYLPFDPSLVGWAR